MLKCLRFLKQALICLYATREITCEMLGEDQWIVLEQIEITLKKMQLQIILEGGNYPTGLLAVLAIYSIHVHYVNVLNSPHAQEHVKSLINTFLQDFDKRYHPTPGNVGKVKFTSKPETGEFILVFYCSIS
jgi:hypothetical protein